MLPIQTVFAELQRQLTVHSQVILQAPPGAGKSTFLPLALLNSAAFSGKIIMLEPRRLAARNIAYYLAEQLGEKVGGRVGYRLRGESKVSAETQLEIVTEGILIRLLQKDPELTGIDLVIFDEFHERNLHADLGLAFCLDVQENLRDNLSILIMSATLDNQALQQHLPNAGYVSCEGRAFPIDYIYYSGKLSTKAEQQSALVALVKEAFQQQSGNILVFVAGVKEILQCCQALQTWIEQHHLPVLLAPLYGRLSLDEQQLAIQSPPLGKRKIVVSTNIAETSLTIDGITVVVDSGRERSFQFQSHTGIGKLKDQMISEASAIQRAGRAGRLSAGTCYRLWSKETRLRSQNEAPIIQSELTDLMLEVSAWGVTHPDQLPFLTQPNARNVQVALQLLQKLNAIDERGRCTQLGNRIIDFGLSPRLGAMLIAAKQLETSLNESGVVALACLLAALIESNEKSSDDINSALDKLSYSVNQQYRVLLKKCAAKAPAQLPRAYCGLLLAIAFPDRIALCRGQNQQQDYLLSNGAGAHLSAHSSLIGEEMLVVTDLALSEQRANSIIFKAAAVSLIDIKAHLAHYLNHEDYLCWSLKENKLIAERRLMSGKITLNKVPLAKVTKQQKLQALLNGLRQVGLSMLYWSDANKALLMRLNYASQQYSEFHLAEFAEFNEQALIDSVDQWLAPFCIDVQHPEQFKKIDLKSALLSRLTWAQQQRFEKDFPVTITVPTGSAIKLQYRDKQLPLLSVKMQELYGQAQTPTILDGRIQVQLALLSPAMKPLQLTQNLQSFWVGAYLEVQKEMKGRYPKHYWPDNPATAVATRKTKKHLSMG
ncbi:ATP-dependent helicase HrpB [Psychromonas sp. GE-S-Ul-11]|uniref:ATP-dependent helicase HrpB n=1 Tax=Psychromonas sp. GE-S-Ul-11 TaxID=3241170 RepID=UPI00390CAC0D